MKSKKQMSYLEFLELQKQLKSTNKNVDKAIKQTTGKSETKISSNSNQNEANS